MDISEINDINTLKAMAFDEIRARATAEANLDVITSRIQQIESAGVTSVDKTNTNPPKSRPQQT